MKRRGLRFLLLGVALYVVLPYLLVQRLGRRKQGEQQQKRPEEFHEIGDDIYKKAALG